MHYWKVVIFCKFVVNLWQFYKSPWKKFQWVDKPIIYADCSYHGNQGVVCHIIKADGSRMRLQFHIIIVLRLCYIDCCPIPYTFVIAYSESQSVITKACPPRELAIFPTQCTGHTMYSGCTFMRVSAPAVTAIFTAADDWYIHNIYNIRFVHKCVLLTDTRTQWHMFA